MRIHWVLHEIHFITTQICPGCYIYTLERSFCLIVSIIINIRYTSRCVIILCSHFGLYRLGWTHWVLYDIHFVATQIRPGFYIYSLERSFCLIVSMIINIRYTSRCVIILCSHFGLCRLGWTHWVLYDIHFVATQIRPGFYIYSLERSFCLIINIMIDIRHISRCVYRYSSQSGLYYMWLRYTISLAPYMSRIYHQLRPEKTRGPDVAPSVSHLIFIRLSWQRAQCHLSEWPRMPHWHHYKAGTVIYTKCHICISPHWHPKDSKVLRHSRQNWTYI